MADDDHFLVVATEREHPLVQQHLSARPVDGEGEHPVRTDLRSHPARVCVPQQPTHPRSPTGRPGQRLADRGPAVGEQLIGIRTPPHELDRVALARRGQDCGQGVVVHTSVHQRADRVALGPRPEAGGPVAAFELRQEPVRDRTLPGLPDPESRSHQRQQLFAVRCPDHGRADGAPGPGRQIDLRTVYVDHLPQRDHRDTIPPAVREIDEHLRVMPPVVAEEHPPHVRHPIRQAFHPGQLACPAAPDHPLRREAPARRHQRARRIAVTYEQVRDRPRQHDRKNGHVEHRRIVQIGRKSADQTGHGQHRTAISKAGRAQGPEPSQKTTQRPHPQHTVHIEDHTMGVPARHAHRLRLMSSRTEPTFPARRSPAPLESSRHRCPHRTSTHRGPPSPPHGHPPRAEEREHHTDNSPSQPNAPTPVSLVSRSVFPPHDNHDQ